jgi:hypothetical protein
MQHLVEIYDKNQQMIERFIRSTLLRVDNRDLDSFDKDNLFNIFPSLELIYITDEHLNQTSPNFEKKGVQNDKHIGVNRDYLLYEDKVESGDDTVTFKEPYISSTTGNLCITAVKKRGENYIFLDFKLDTLLKRFSLYDGSHIFESFLKYFYSFISLSLIALGLFLSGYGMYKFTKLVFIDFNAIELVQVFKPVIALTLGLAIFDLGKTIFEQEVINNSYSNEVFKPKTLMNFTVSILIALMIESLLIVFKISLNNYQDLIYALYLIIGTALLFLSFTLFLYLHKRSKKIK